MESSMGIEVLLIMNKEKFISEDKKNHKESSTRFDWKRVITHEADNDVNYYLFINTIDYVSFQIQSNQGKVMVSLKFEIRKIKKNNTSDYMQDWQLTPNAANVIVSINIYSFNIHQ